MELRILRNCREKLVEVRQEARAENASMVKYSVSSTGDLFYLHQRWVKGYRPDDYIALNHTGRLLEHEIGTFKGIKITNKANPLQDVIQHVVEHIVPAAKKQ